MKTAVFPGSFDPITTGHADIVLRAAEMFDLVVVAVSDNTSKKYMFPSDVRFAAAKAAFAFDDRIKVIRTSGLVADVVSTVENEYGGKAVLLKGVRNPDDFVYEYEMYECNRAIGGCETVFLPAKKELVAVSSTFVRELIIHGRDFSAYVPENSYIYLKKN